MKTLNKILGFALVAAVFASCSKDDTTDYTLKDITPLIGSYSGSCTISSTDFPQKVEETQSTNVYFRETDNAKLLSLETTEFGFISTPVIKNFKTSKDGKSYTFSLDGFNKSWSAIPAYIETWMGSNYASIESVKATLNSTTGTYDLATKTITFTYTAKTTIVGVYASGGKDTQIKTVTYKYTAIQN